MNNLTDNELIVFALALFVLWLSAQIGCSFLKRRLSLAEDVREDFSVILTATDDAARPHYGFSFSMAISRYQQRKNYEEEEANAIGTEYLRANLLPAADAARVRALLRDYLDERILFYRTRDEQQLRQINANTAQLQSELWAAVKTPPHSAADTHRRLGHFGHERCIELAGIHAGFLVESNPACGLGSVGPDRHCCNLLFGYGARHPEAEGSLMLILPIVVSISFFLVGDIDSPRGGVIVVQPQNLVSLAQSLQAP